MNYWGLVVSVGGIFTIASAAMDWDYFMEHHKAKPLVALFGRNGVRIFYGVAGAAFVVVGWSIFIGVIKNSS